MPAQPFRAGDFSSVLPRVVIYDPSTGNPDTGAGRQPSAGNRIPDSRISPITRRILALVPAPNLGSDVVNNYNSATRRIKDSNSFDVKVDHQQTSKDRFSARYSFQRPVIDDAGRFGTANELVRRQYRPPYVVPERV